MDILRANRLASIIAQAVVLPMMIFPTAVSTLAAQTPESYEKLISLAHGYVKESKYEEALDHLTKAYAIQPNPQLLAEIGKAYLVVGKATEARDAFSKVLAEGGEFTLEFLHRHNAGQCYGSMMVSKSQIKWAGHGKADHFEVAPHDVGPVDSGTYYAWTWRTGEIAIPLIKLRATAGKNWTYELLLYGATRKYKTETEGWTDKYVVYTPNQDLEKFQKATEVILWLLEDLCYHADTHSPHVHR